MKTQFPSIFVVVIIVVTALTPPCVSGEPYNMHLTHNMAETCQVKFSCTQSSVDGTLIVNKGQTVRIGLCEFPKIVPRCHVSCDKLYQNFIGSLPLSTEIRDVYWLLRSTGVYSATNNLPLNDPKWFQEYNWNSN